MEFYGINSITRWIKHVIMPCLFYGVVGMILVYFWYQAEHGSRGLTVKRQLESEIETLSQRLSLLNRERDDLKARIDLLNPKHLDRDLLDELVRAKLGWVGPQERLLLKPSLHAQESSWGQGAAGPHN